MEELRWHFLNISMPLSSSYSLYECVNTQIKANIYNFQESLHTNSGTHINLKDIFLLWFIYNGNHCSSNKKRKIFVDIAIGSLSKSKNELLTNVINCHLQQKWNEESVGVPTLKNRFFSCLPADRFV